MEQLGRDNAELMNPAIPEWAQEYFDYEAFGKAESSKYIVIELSNGELASFE